MLKISNINDNWLNQINDLIDTETMMIGLFAHLDLENVYDDCIKEFSELVCNKLQLRGIGFELVNYQSVGTHVLVQSGNDFERQEFESVIGHCLSEIQPT